MQDVFVYEGEKQSSVPVHIIIKVLFIDVIK